MSDVFQRTCNACGLYNEFAAKRNFGDYNPLCKGCNAPLIERVSVPWTEMATQGGLALAHIPNRGLGVAARVDIPEGQLIERCPVLVLEHMSEEMKTTMLLPYAESKNGMLFNHMTFPWITDTVRCIVLGYGMLYNHESSEFSNIRSEPYIDPNTHRRFIDIYTKKAVKAGEELCSTYATEGRVWFQPKPGLPLPKEEKE
jgi:hypothetical protein